ncbi:tetratricopeptide repeat protein [candidate division KSB1 bacterium]|nr:tetratricopeptide repeat protein [candidate division KSB1 bacterium]
MKIGNGIFLLLSVALINGCATRKEIVSFKNDSAYLRARVDSLHVEQRRLRHTFEQFQAQTEKNANALIRLHAETQVQLNQLIERVQALDDRLVDMGNRFSSSPAQWRPASSLTPADANASAPADTSQAGLLPGALRLYDLAYRDLVRGHFGLARQGFMQYLRLLPEGEVAAFQHLLDIYPTSSQAPKALFKLADCQLALGNSTGGKKSLEALAARFPLTPEARLAQARLQEIK